MNLGHELGSLGIVLILLKKELTSLLIQSRLGIRVNKKTANHHKHVLDAQGRIPVLLQGVDADLASFGNIGVENLCQKRAFGRYCRKLGAQGKLAAEYSSLKRSVYGAINVSNNVGDIVFLEMDSNSLHRVCQDAAHFLENATHGGRRKAITRVTLRNKKNKHRNR